MSINVYREIAMDEILTVQEVADYLKISRSTVWRWCNEGKLTAFKVGRSWRIHRTVLEKMVYHNRNKNTFEIDH